MSIYLGTTPLADGASTALLVGKADVDLSNINPTQTAKNTIVGWGMPDYSNGTAISSLPYTATQKGLVFITCQRSSNNSNSGYITINGTKYICFVNVSGSTVGSSTAQVYVSLGDEIDISGNSIFTQGYFVPLKGV